MEKLRVEGVVVRVSHTGESDRIIWILTRDGGVIRAFAKGTRNVKNKLHSATGQFVYGSFWLTKTRDAYNVTDAEIKEMFFDLRRDLTAMTLAQYFCEAAVKCIVSADENEEHLRLLLNSLHFLSSRSKPPEYIKSVYEMRTCVLLGYAPKVVACEECGEFETPHMYFDCLTGTVFCEKCGDPRSLPLVDVSVIRVVRHIVFSPFGRIFSFDCAGLDLDALNRLTEQYFLNCVQTRFETLEFYHK